MHKKKKNFNFTRKPLKKKLTPYFREPENYNNLNIGDMQWLIWLWVTNVVVKLNFFPHYLGRYLVTKVTERITYLKLKFAIFLESNKTLGT